MKYAIFAAALMAVGASVLHGATPTPSNGSLGISPHSRDAYARSYQLEQRRYYAQAIKALQGQPSGYLLELRLGWLNYLSGAYAPAVTHYRAAGNMAPSSVEARLGALLPLIALKRYAEAETIARQVLRIDDGNYYANLRLAYVLRMQGKYAAAETILKRMVPRYPTDASFLTELALDEVALKHNASAKGLFADILTLNPYDTLAKQEAARL